VTAVQGVQPGEVVAISGFDKLTDGAKVTISKPQGAGGGSGSGGHKAANGGSSP